MEILERTPPSPARYKNPNFPIGALLDARDSSLGLNSNSDTEMLQIPHPKTMTLFLLLQGFNA